MEDEEEEMNGIGIGAGGNFENLGASCLIFSAEKAREHECKYSKAR